MDTHTKVEEQKKEIRATHTPVLLNEVLSVLAPKPGQFMIDGTLGAGGHAREIIKRLGENGKFLGLDWDGNTVAKLSGKVRGILMTGNYADLPEILRTEKLGRADGILLDLGFSSEQLESGRGFSFRKDEPLLMTYSDDTTPAYQLLRQLNKRELAGVIRDLSDERYADRIAEAIVEREKKKLIRTSGELAEVVRSVLPRQYERGRIDPATRTFQALRMFTNNELGNLEKFLSSLTEILKHGGRAVVISFHSKEDRIVKNCFRDLAKEGKAKLLTKKPMTATDEEIKKNYRSRSAKLRAIQII